MATFRFMANADVARAATAARVMRIDFIGWFLPALKTCANAASTCKAFEICRRREVLSFSQHVKVATLPPLEAYRLLNWFENPWFSICSISLKRNDRFRRL
jgi:hypothetical protein